MCPRGARGVFARRIEIGPLRGALQESFDNKIRPNRGGVVRKISAFGVLAGLAVLLGGAGFSSVAQAQMYRCKTASGGAVVQDTPCRDNAAAGKATPSGGLDLLSPRQCVWWSHTVSLASGMTKCVLIFQKTEGGYTVDYAQVSVAGKVVRLRLFDSRVEETELSPGLSVTGSERYSYASPDKSVQVFLSSALVPPSRKDNDGSGYWGDRLRYRGNLTVKTAAGEKTVAIAYERPQGASR